MTQNGSNNWSVSYAHISWFNRLLSTHSNVKSVSRHTDLVFEIVRDRQGDKLKVVCLNEYTMGITAVQRVIAEFGKPSIIYIGGGWCGYTQQAKEFCIQERIGLYVSDEMSGGFGRMTIGDTINEIKTAIRSITSAESELEGIFGFGSFFRGEPFNDLDLLAVAAKRNSNTLATYYELVAVIEPVALKLGCPLHLTLLTSHEFATRPLRNMAELHQVWAPNA